MTLNEIKQKIEGLKDLDLHFGYEQSGDIYEMRRVAGLVMRYFGLREKPDVKKRYTPTDTTFSFLLEGQIISQYHNHANGDEKIGHDNVMSCISDLVCEALCRHNKDASRQIAELFDPWTARLPWRYS